MKMIMSAIIVAGLAGPIDRSGGEMQPLRFGGSERSKLDTRRFDAGMDMFRSAGLRGSHAVADDPLPAP